MPSLVQRLVVRLLPGRAAQIEQESRDWLVICPECGHQRSYWEIGGVRFGARSKGKRIGLRCPACGKRGMHRVEARVSDGSAEETTSSSRAERPR